MQAKDIMTTTVATVPPEASIRDIARLLLERRISAARVVDLDGQFLGIVGEGDLLRRFETGMDTQLIHTKSDWTAATSDSKALKLGRQFAT